jgi:hypothetical protein
MMKFARTMLVLLLCCAVSPVRMVAQEAGAMLSASGQVTVNGTPVSGSVAVFPGDKIHSGPDSSANILTKGTTATLGQNSSLTWQPQGIQLQDGSLTLAAQSPWKVSVGPMTVALGSELTKIEVSQREDVALFKLVQGSATLSEAGKTTPLKVGFTVAHPNSAGKAAAPAVAAKHSSHTALIVVLVAGGAAAGIGLGAKGGGSKTQTPVSPSVP